MRFAILVLALPLLPFPLAAQTSVQRARQAAEAVTGHDHATSGQLSEAVGETPAEHEGHAAPGMDHSGHQEQAPPAMDHSGHQDHAAPAMDHPTTRATPEGPQASDPPPSPRLHDPARAASRDRKLGGFIAADPLPRRGGRDVTSQIVDKPPSRATIFLPQLCPSSQIPDAVLPTKLRREISICSAASQTTPELPETKRNYLRQDFKYPRERLALLRRRENIRC